MALMIPPYVDPATKSGAERRLFKKLMDDPATRDWVVLHSLNLVRRDDRPYGEIDFVVLVPGVGVCCLEVKGGRIRCRRGVWTTIDREGHVHRLSRSPFSQAQEGMRAVEKSLRDRGNRTLPRNLLTSYAVVMPDVHFDTHSIEWEPWQAIDRASLRQPISASILTAIEESRRLDPHKSHGIPAQTHVELIKELLRPDFDLVVTRSAQIEQAEEQLLTLTKEQHAVLDQFSDNDRCLFVGAAGTGKTVLAMECARRSAAQGLRTLLVCFNRLLGGWLTKQYNRGGSVVAGSYHEVVRELIAASPFADELQTCTQTMQAGPLLSEVYPRLARRLAQDSGRQFDLLVMDEAQDLCTPPVLETLDGLLVGGLSAGRWAAFGDFHHQAIFCGKTGEEIIAFLRSKCPWFSRGRLTVNCRNTRTIAEDTALLAGFAELPYEIRDVSGMPVEYQYYDCSGAQCRALSNVLARMFTEGVPASAVTVLSRLTLEKSAARDCGGHGPYRLVETEVGRPLPPGCVRFSTIHSFKGMESPAVVVCDVDDLREENQKLLYIAMSRARSHLTVLLDEATAPLIPEEILKKIRQGRGGLQALAPVEH